MKYYELKQIVEYLKKFKKISDIERVDDNVIKIVFDEEPIYFDLSKGDSKIYKRDDFVKTKRYNAPFDIVLQKRFKKAKIKDISILDNDKIIKITTISSSSYKEIKTILQLEFTGRNTNAIILDENENILEALRHIDISTSFREVKPGKKLLPLPPLKKISNEDKKIENIEKYLYEVFQNSLQKKLDSLKSVKIYTINKQIEKLKNLLNSLENEKDLQNLAQIEEMKANLILANLHNIKPYDKEIKLKDFEGKDITIQIPPNIKSTSQIADIFFNKARKFRQKAKNIHIERENLHSKILFLERMKNRIENAKNIEEIEILFPKKESQKSKKVKFKNYEKFIIEGFEIYIGKNEKGNIEILKKAKASDIWMHLKDIPSAHIIIKTNKQNIPQNILQEAAKLCVDFSVEQKGDYLVDFTQRRNVKIIENAHVNYVNYKTIKVRKV
ncbi:NFACT RNA binding domain-containing protein [Nitrosophilus kaiyonis]|uniref:NFACT RNA binding domain-containing protein n=1 Tax=Nitrosophilus kaiyonis TaxID=2930200 RepID=UPI0024915FA4|nr:NFACT RNA binding domain-containing protein [Nitrosophilus kaiyonis]